MQAINRHITIVLILFVILWYKCWTYVGLSNYFVLLEIVSMAMILFMLIMVLDEISFKKYRLPSCIFFSTVLSMIMCMLFWDVGIYESLRSFKSYYLVLVFFFLIKINADNKDVEKALLLLGVLYVICWLYQVYKVPELVFGIDRDDNIGDTSERGFYRFFIPTKEHLPFLILYMYELYRRNKRKIFITLSVLFMIIVILHVGRQMMFWSFVAIVLFVLYTNKKQWKKLLLVSLILFSSTNVIIENIPTVKILMEKTESQTSSADEDIRYKCIEYYLKQSVSNPVTFVMGNGIGYYGKLGKFTKRAQENGYYETDIGFFALLFDFGLFGVIVYLLLFFKIIRIRVDDRYLYLKFYFVYIYGSYLLAHTLTTNIFFNMCALLSFINTNIFFHIAI